MLLLLIVKKCLNIQERCMNIFIIYIYSNKHKHHKRLGQFEVHLWRPSSWTNQLIYSACNNGGKLPEISFILHSLKSIIKTAILHPIPETNRGTVNIRVQDSVTDKFLPGASIYLYKVELLTSDKLLVYIIIIIVNNK